MAGKPDFLRLEPQIALSYTGLEFAIDMARKNDAAPRTLVVSSSEWLEASKLIDHLYDDGVTEAGLLDIVEHQGEPSTWVMTTTRGIIVGMTGS